jgi:hypothetical protein
VALLSFDGAPHGGSQRHLPEWQSQPRMTPTTIIDHSIVGSAEGAWLMFRDGSVLESHFIVHKDGLIWQLMDTGRQADANLHANDFAISIETEDDGDPDTQPWTRAQMESLAWLHNKLARVHPSIPRRLCPSEAGGGLGYHTLFGAPSAWTPVAKSCPGAVRKRQWREVLLPAFISGTAPSPPPPPPLRGDDMFILRCDRTAGTAGRQLRLVNGQRHRIITLAERAELGAEGVTEHDLTGHPGLYDDVLELAEHVAAPLELSPQQLADLGKAVADNLEVAGHPTLTITGTAVPAPS